MSNEPAGQGQVDQTVRPCLIVYGDGINDDAEVLQAHLDGLADLVHADGTPYRWPGTPKRKYRISQTLYIGTPEKEREKISLSSKAWFGAA